AKRRLRDIGEARIAIEKCLENPEKLELAPEDAHRSADVVDAVRWAVMIALAFGLAMLAYTHFTEAPPAAEPVRFQVLAPENATAPKGQAVSLSPDGRHLVFMATDADGVSRLWIRSLDSSNVRSLPGTEGVGGGRSALLVA